MDAGYRGRLLPQPVQLFANGVPTFLNAMLVGPAERFDIIVDFTACAGSKFILYSDAPGPYPGGAPFFDFYFGAAAAKPKKNANPNAPIAPGFGPNTRTIMQFRVNNGLNHTSMTAPAAIAQDIPVTLAPAAGGALPAFPAPLPPLTVPALPAGFVWGANGLLNPRYLTLNEDIDAYGRLMPTIGTNVPVVYYCCYARPDPRGGGKALARPPGAGCAHSVPYSPSLANYRG